MDEFATTQVDLSIGNVWNGYEIVGKIGSGGMGVVYKAIQKNPQRTVAIKVDSSAKKGNSRFTQEMQIAAELDHPNIGRIYDAGVIGQYYYMVMEFIDGQPLDEYLQNNDLSLKHKIEILIPLCSALRYAHRKGIVHRDLKPANILIKENATPVIIDFGLAKKMSNQEFDLTKTGEVLGTPAYMAPEQVSGKGALIHEQTDIYAMGAIFYEMVTGKRMISGDGTLEILFKIQQETAPAPSKIDARLDKSIDTIWENATARKQEQRYKTIRMFANDLKLLLQNKSIKTNYTFLQRFKWIIAAIIIIIASGLFIVVTRSKETSQKMHLSSEEQKVQKQVDAIIDNIHNRQFQNARTQIESVFDKISKLREESYKVIIAKAYHENGMLEDALNILHKFPDREEYSYYKALHYYRDEQYIEAKKLFSQQSNSNSEYYLAKCLLKEADALAKQNSKDIAKANDLYKQALNYLIPIENDFGEDIEFLEAMAHIYSQDASFRSDEKAEKYLRVCVEKKPMVVQYSIKLAKIYLNREKYYDAFALARKVLYVSNDLDAAELLHEIPYHAPNLREQCYQAITYKFLKESIMPCPDLLNDEWKKLQQNYQELYTEWLKGQRQLFAPATLSQKLQVIVNNLRNLSENSTTQETLYRNLKSLRYNESLQKKIRLLENDLPKELANKISHVLEEALQTRNHEQQAMIFHQLIYTQYNNTWLHNPFTDQDLQRLEYMLTQKYKTTSIPEKYLLVKGYMYFKGFEQLLDICHNDKFDLITRIVTGVVLRENFLAVRLPLKEYQNYSAKISPQEDQFLKILVARSLYTSHLRKPLDYTFRIRSRDYELVVDRDEKLFLHKLIQNAANSQRLRIAAAASLHCLLQHQNDAVLSTKSAQILVKQGMNSQSPLVRQYAHYMFWVKKHIHKGNAIPPQKLIEIFRRGINDEHYKVKEVVLSFSEKCDNLIKELISDIEECLRNEKNHSVRFRAMFAYSMVKGKEKFIFNEGIYVNPKFKISPLENSATFVFNFFQFYKDLRDKDKVDMQNVFRAVRLLSGIMDYFPQLPKSSQCMISYQLSLLNVHLSLDKIDDAKTLSYLLYQLHQEMHFGEDEKKLPIPNKKSRREKRSIAENFLRHPEKEVRYFATIAYISLGTLEQLQEFYEKNRDDKATHKAIAQGINLFMQNYWIDNSQGKESLRFDDVFSWKTNDLIRFQKLKKMREFFDDLRKQNPSQMQKLLYWLKKSCELDPENSHSIATAALFYFDKNNFLDNISKALELNRRKVEPENHRYIQHIYVLNAAKMVQQNYSDPGLVIKEQGWQQALSPDTFPNSLLPALGHYYISTREYPLALRAYEKNFLARIDDFSPFKSARDHWAMIRICLRANNEKLAKLLFASLYQVYRREKEGAPIITPKVFLKKIQSEYEDIKIDIGK